VHFPNWHLILFYQAMKSNCDCPLNFSSMLLVICPNLFSMWSIVLKQTNWKHEISIWYTYLCWIAQSCSGISSHNVQLLKKIASQTSIICSHCSLVKKILTTKEKSPLIWTQHWRFVLRMERASGSHVLASMIIGCGSKFGEVIMI